MIVINNTDEMISFVQDKLYEQLKEIDRICVENNIKYSLSGGTFLGAIRHNGFIPWDDDADILMERSQFEKFRNIMSSKTPNNYKLIRYNWVYCFCERIMVQYEGQTINTVNTDIFVCDKVPLSKLLFKIQITTLKILQGMIKEISKLKWKNRTLIQNIAQAVTWVLGLPFKLESKIKWYDKVSQMYNNNRDYIELFGSNDQFKYIDKTIPRSLFENITTHKFRDSTFMILGDYDYYLTKWYGNYMKLPAKEDQVPNHSIKSRHNTAKVLL